MKRELGQYFTTYNPFQNDGFLNWAEECNLSKATILEPFAGANNLINMLQNMGLCSDFKSFDIEPQNNDKEKIGFILNIKSANCYKDKIKAGETIYIKAKETLRDSNIAYYDGEVFYNNQNKDKIMDCSIVVMESDK